MDMDRTPRRGPGRRAATGAWMLGGAVLLAGAVWIFSHLRLSERQAVLAGWRQRVEMIAAAKARAVEVWLDERRADARLLAWDPDFVGLCTGDEDCARAGSVPRLQTQLDNLRVFAGFLGAYLLSPDGRALLTAREGRGPCRETPAVARRVARERRFRIHDIHRAQDGTPMVGFLAPVLRQADPGARAAGAPVVGVVGLYLDPRGALFPLLDPGGSPKDGVVSYLVRRAGDRLEILPPSVESSLGRASAHPPGPAASPLPLSLEEAALRGSTPPAISVDRWGRRVIGAVRLLPEPGWGVVASVPEGRALAGWRRQVLVETALGGLSLLCVLLGGVAVWRTWAGRHHRRLVEELREREERLRALAQGSEDVVYIQDLQGRYLLVNPAAEALLGACAERAVGRRARDFLPSEVSEALEARDREAIERGSAVQWEETLPVKGRERIFLGARVPIRDARGEIRGVAGVLRDITDRKRDEEQLARWAHTLAALYRLAGKLAGAGDAAAVLRQMVDGAAGAFQADFALLYLADSQGDGLNLADGRDVPDGIRRFFGRLRAGQGVTGRVWRTGRVEVVEDYRDDPDALPSPDAGTWLRSLGAVPLRAEGETLGVLVLGYTERRPFRADERRALEMLGYMAGAALERVRAREALEEEARSRRRAEDRLRRLHHATAGLTGEDLFQAVARTLTRELGVRWVMVNRVDPAGRAAPLAACVDGRREAIPPFPLEGTPCGEVVATGGPVHHESGMAGRIPLGSLGARLGIDAYAGVPLSDSRGHTVGVLCALHSEPLHLGEAEWDLLDLYARRVAGEVERLRAEQHLTKTRRTLETLIGNLPGAVYRCACASARPATYLSEGIASVTGYGPAAFDGGGKRLGDLIVPDDRPRVWRAVEEAVEEGRPYELEYRIRDAAGELRWVYDVGRAVEGDGGGERVLEGVLFDHTERRSLEAQLIHSQKMEALGRLAGGVAHDFNNLLTAISGYAELLLRRLPASDDSRRGAEEIVRAADRAADLTRQLLAFGRRQMVEPRVVDMNETIRGVVRMVERLLGEDVEVRLDLGAEVGSVRADPGQVEQAVVNLAVNARDAMPEGGVLAVRTRRAGPDECRRLGLDGEGRGDHVVLEVSDTGVGMEQRVMEHIFEPFFTTKEAGKGTGLGLATVYGVVTQAGGGVSVESRVGEGTTFRLFWPCWSEPPRSAAGGGGGGASAGETRGERVALVEDEPAVLELAAEHLRDCGYRVEAFPSGREALAALEAGEEVDLLITDVVMPGMAGPRLAHRLRQRWPRLPVIYVSGHTGEAAADLQADGWGTRFLEKPFRLSELDRTVREALEERARER
ncbi:MAG: hypothetical protein Kow0092_25450 [Deferrisomatales bacterium]